MKLIYAASVAAVAANGVHDANGKLLEGLAPSEVEMGVGGKLSDRTPTITPWASHRTGTPPYVPPTSRKYNTKGGPVAGKINVHITPHTHDDTGWQVTVDQYYHNEVYYVVDTVVTELMKDENRRFMYVHRGYGADEGREPASSHNLTNTLLHQVC
jgi:alpha-mannosidase